MEQSRPGRIDDWNPGPEYIAENEPKQRKIVSHSSREKRMSLARAEAAKESISEIVAKPWEKFFEDEEQIASSIRKSSTKEQLTSKLGARARSSSRRSSFGRDQISSNGSFLSTLARNLVPSTTSDQSVNSPRRNSTATVVFDFQARNARELSVLRDDSVLVDEIKNEQWAQCTKGSASGVVPLAYLRNNDRSSLSSLPRSPLSAKKGSAVAAFDLDSKSERHLRLEKGDTVQLINKLDKNWYEGVNPLTNESGIIPANYLANIVEPSSNKHPRNRTVSSDEVFEISSQQTTTARSSYPSKSEKIRQSLKDELDLAMKELSSHLQH